MAKKKSPATPAATGSAAVTNPKLAELERHWESGNYVGGRRLAHAILNDSSMDPATQHRARELLGMMNVDRVPLAVFVGMLVVLLVVFMNAIVSRNRGLQDAPPSIELNKQLAPPPPAAPVQGTEPAAPAGTEPATGSGDVPPG
ncbi:MAG: hypothetical protein AB2A00_07075 [Myxococcota bacterium]